MICLPLVLFLDYELASGDAGFEPTGDLGQWVYDVPSVGPLVDHQPMWSTRPHGNTLNDAEELLTVNLPSVAGLARPVLVIEHATALGSGDLARFELDTGSGFAPVVPIHGYPQVNSFRGSTGGFVSTGIDLTGVPPGSRFRFRFVADATGSGPGWFVRQVQVVDGDPIPPVVTVQASPGDTQDQAGPYAVRVDIDEDVAVRRAELFYLADGVQGSVQLFDDGSSWVGAIPGQPADTVVEWRVEVEDCESVVNVAGSPFRVFLPAPQDLSGPTLPHTVARSVDLDWEPPDTHLPVDGYVIEELSSGVRIVEADTRALIELDPDWEQAFQVRALYDGVEGDASDVLQLDVEVPQLLQVEPGAVYPGDRVYLSLEGSSLYLLQGASSLSFGTQNVEELQVLEWTVLDVDRARALVQVPSTVEVGAKDIVVTGTRGTFRFPSRLDVRDAADAPRITRVEPGSVEQGEQVTLEIHASRVFGPDVEITSDEEILLGGDPTVDGDRLTVSLAATGRARAGEHVLVVDDGIRAYEVEITVTEYRYQGRRGCATTGSSGERGFGLALLLASFIIRLRTRGPWRSPP